MIPTRLSPCMTGMPLISLSAMMRAASSMGVSGVTVTTSLVITFSTNMRFIMPWISYWSRVVASDGV